jgi:hypothetical protein
MTMKSDFGYGYIETKFISEYELNAENITKIAKFIKNKEDNSLLNIIKVNKKYIKMYDCFVERCILNQGELNERYFNSIIENVNNISIIKMRNYFVSNILDKVLPFSQGNIEIETLKKNIMLYIGNSLDDLKSYWIL